MRCLARNEKPVVGSTVEVIYRVKVTSVEADGSFSSINPNRDYPSYFLWKGGSHSRIDEISAAPKARVWKTGAMYCFLDSDSSLPGSSAYWLRLADGWKSVSDGEIFRDDSRFLSSRFLDRLKIMEVKDR